MLQTIIKALKNRLTQKKQQPPLSRKNATKRPKRTNTLSRKLTRRMTRKKTLARRKSTKKQQPIEYADMDALFC